jgi:hypothetical protein
VPPSTQPCEPSQSRAAPCAWRARLGGRISRLLAGANPPTAGGHGKKHVCGHQVCPISSLSTGSGPVTTRAGQGTRKENRGRTQGRRGEEEKKNFPLLPKTSPATPLSSELTWSVSWGRPTHVVCQGRERGLFPPADNQSPSDDCTQYGVGQSVVRPTEYTPYSVFGDCSISSQTLIHWPRPRELLSHCKVRIRMFYTTQDSMTYMYLLVSCVQLSWGFCPAAFLFRLWTSVVACCCSYSFSTIVSFLSRINLAPVMVIFPPCGA